MSSPQFVNWLLVLMNNDPALVPGAVMPNGNGKDTAMGKPGGNTSSSIKNSPAPQPLSDEIVDAILKGRGLRGWLRVGRVAGVLGLFTLYLFLDTYDVRANFNQRMAARLSEETPQSLAARLKKLYHRSEERRV